MRRGLTLIEMIVVISIIAVLIGLILPAVQKVRAAADRTRCSANLRQITLAAHSFHDAHRQFPSGHLPNHIGWPLHLLPFMDQETVWHDSIAALRQNPNPFANPPHRIGEMHLSMFVCPADFRAHSAALVLRTNHATLGLELLPTGLLSYLGVQGIDRTRRDGIFFTRSRIRFNDIRDGSSNTLMLGERPISADRRYGWWYAASGDDGFGTCDFVLGVRESARRRSEIDSCGSAPFEFMNGQAYGSCSHLHFWSLHSGGGHFAFCDGSVRFLSHSANRIMPELSTRHGGEVAIP